MTLGISVIVPVYNREKYISECIQSILSQDYNGNIEIIICDDGSSDKSLEIAQSFGDKIVVLQKPNDCKTQGASGARNRGIEKASYNYISFLDSDDYYLPGHLRMMSETLDKHTELGFAFCRSKKEFITSNGDKIISDWTRTKMTALDKEYHVLYRSYCINTNTIVARKEVFEQVGGFNTNLKIGEDSEMWMRMSERFRHQFVDYYGAVYRTEQGSEQLTATSLAQKRNCNQIIITDAFARNYTTANCDTMRLFLIIRALLYDKIQKRNSKLGIVYNHVIVMNKLFHISPSDFFKFISQKLNIV